MVIKSKIEAAITAAFVKRTKRIFQITRKEVLANENLENLLPKDTYVQVAERMRKFGGDKYQKSPEKEILSSAFCQPMAESIPIEVIKNAS